MRPLLLALALLALFPAPALATRWGIYDQFLYGEEWNQTWPTAAKRFDLMRDAGLGLVMNYGTGYMSGAEAKRYADTARRFGIRVIWNLADVRQSVGERLALAEATRRHPATWGYYLGDEVDPSDPAASQMLALSGLIDSRTLYVSRPRRDLLAPFAGAFDRAGPDVYPICAPHPEPLVKPTALWARQLLGNRLALVLQLFNWGLYLDTPGCWPSRRQVLGARRKAQRFGRPRVVLWYCLCDVDRHPKARRYWRRVRGALVP